MGHQWFGDKVPGTENIWLNRRVCNLSSSFIETFDGNDAFVDVKK
jgi:hypothetical protein